MRTMQQADRSVMTERGMSWNVLDAGVGDRTLVLLPGTLGSVDIFRHQVAAFSEGCRVVVLGYPGTCNLTALRESFWGLLDTLGVHDPVLAGSSLGAYLLQHFTAEPHPPVRHLLLGNTFVDSHRLRFLRMFDPAFIGQASPQEAKALWLAFVDGIKLDALRHALLPMVRDEQSDAELYGRSLAISSLGPVALSTLPAERITLLSCADDPVCNVRVADEVARAYAGARHVRLDTGAHYPHLIDPKAYNAVLASAFD